MLAKTHRLEEECENILESSGLTENQIKLPTIGSPLSPPKPIISTFRANWPTKASSQSFFEKALLSQLEEPSSDNEQATETDNFAITKSVESSVQKQNSNSIDVDEDESVAGWDVGDDMVPEVEGNILSIENIGNGVGSSEAELWARNSPVAADHVAGGSFETAMQLLNRQLGAVQFASLKPRFLEIYQASKTYLPTSSGLPPLVNYVWRTVDESDSREALPIIPRDIQFLASNDLQKGYMAMRSNKLQDGIVIFRGLLHALIVNSVSSASEIEEAKKLISSACEYTLAISIELSRRNLGTDDEISKSPDKLKRNLELAAYFTIPKLEVPHRQLALNSAMKISYSNKNLKSALSFANRMLANGGASKLIENVS